MTKYNQEIFNEMTINLYYSTMIIYKRILEFTYEVRLTYKIHQVSKL